HTLYAGPQVEHFARTRRPTPRPSKDGLLVTTQISGNRVLRLDHVVIERGGNTVLRVSGVETGSPGTLFVVGPGGAGKSSLLGALSGHELAQTRVASGQLQLNHVDLTSTAVKRVWISQHETLRPSGDVRTELAQRLNLDETAVGDWLHDRAG